MAEHMLVSLRNDPMRRGFLTGRERPRNDSLLLQVQFPDGSDWIPEDQIVPAEQIYSSPLDMLEEGLLGSLEDLRRTLTHMKLSGRLTDIIYSLEATSTEFHAYQFKPVLKILESPTNGLLIADEVGLGKTIETGLIWTELRSRFEHMRRLLVLCPAALREKWRRELFSKFGVDARICDAKAILARLEEEDENPRGFAMIASVQGLRPPTDWEEETKHSPRAELARFLRSHEHEQSLFDLLVIDEAHHLRNPATKTNEIGRLAKNVAEYLVLLTATPVHNRNEDLLSLLCLLDPETFPRGGRNVLDYILEANAPLLCARDLVLRSTMATIDELRDLLNKAQSHPLLRSNRQLTAIAATIEQSPDCLQNRNTRGRLAEQLEKTNLLSHVVTRTLKRDVKEWRTLREPISESVPLDPIEEKFYTLVTEVVRQYALDRDANESFLAAQPQRQMTSSMAASLRSWQKKLASLENANGGKKRLGPLISEIIRRSHDFVEIDGLIRVDGKYRRLHEIVQSLLSSNQREKIIVFSAFRATLDYLAERLKADGIDCIVLKGGQRETKDETIQAFSERDEASVLLSSEVGAEGIDLQFARMVINYDLPWNPMRLEQRIGRIDRLGQKADKILIWNIFHEATIDAKIYRRLYEKLDLCRIALGNFEEILGEEIRRLTLDLFRLNPQQQEERIDQTAQALENLRLQEQSLEQNAALLTAHGDYILDQIDEARRLFRWISGDGLRHYVFDYLQLHYPDCSSSPALGRSSVFMLHLSDSAKVELREFIDSGRLPTTKLTSNQHAVRCRFNNRVGGVTNRYEEEISQFHPLVRWVNHKIETQGKQNAPAVALILHFDDLDRSINIPTKSGAYVLAVAMWSCQALHSTERLAYAAAPLSDGANLLEPELAERLAAAVVNKGENWIEARNLIDLQQAFKIANDSLFAELHKEYEQFRENLQIRNEDQIDVQIQHLERYRENKEADFRKQKEKARERKNDAQVKAVETRIRNLEVWISQRRLKIEKKRTIHFNSREIAVAIINIVEDQSEN